MKKRILIIDDNENDLLIMERYFNRAGYSELITTKDPAEGIRRAIEEKPDLVITDTLLPQTDGFEVCRHIRSGCGPNGPKIIIVTGSIDAVDAMKARQSGADDYCAKTSNCANIVEAVKKLI